LRRRRSDARRIGAERARDPVARTLCVCECFEGGEGLGRDDKSVSSARGRGPLRRSRSSRRLRRIGTSGRAWSSSAGFVAITDQADPPMPTLTTFLMGFPVAPFSRRTNAVGEVRHPASTSCTWTRRPRRQRRATRPRQAKSDMQNGTVLGDVDVLALNMASRRVSSLTRGRVRTRAPSSRS